MNTKPRCELCGEPMPDGEEMFRLHGYSGPCPKPPKPRDRRAESALKDLRIAVFKALPETGWDGHASDCATHNDPAYPNGECDCGAEASEVRLQKPDWTAACEAMRWLNEVEIAQGGTNGPTIKLRAALAALEAELAAPPDLAARVAELEAALRNLLNDTQHSEHHCGDEACPVSIARAVLAKETQ